MKKFFPLLVFSLLWISCATKKQILYFQDAEALNAKSAMEHYEPIIEKNDVLYISVSSMNVEVVEPFKRNTGENYANSQNQLLQGYLVDSNGTIRFPVLGEITVAGSTRAQVVTMLRDRLSEFITDVVVDVRIMNFKITVLGAVNRPGVYSIQDERVTLPQALGLAGDLSVDGKRSEIMIVREVDGKQQVAHVDLTATDFFESPFYFLKQNDLVYVQPSLKGVKKSGFIPDIPALLSLFTVVLSTVIIITR